MPTPLNLDVEVLRVEHAARPIHHSPPLAVFDAAGCEFREAENDHAQVVPRHLLVLLQRLYLTIKKTCQIAVNKGVWGLGMGDRILA
jgi:hypothetical protein